MRFSLSRRRAWVSLPNCAISRRQCPRLKLRHPSLSAIAAAAQNYKDTMHPLTIAGVATNAILFCLAFCEKKPGRGVNEGALHWPLLSFKHPLQNYVQGIVRSSLVCSDTPIGRVKRNRKKSLQWLDLIISLAPRPHTQVKKREMATDVTLTFRTRTLLFTEFSTHKH